MQYESTSLGAIHEATGNHEIGFDFAGAMVITSSLLIFTLNRVDAKSKRVNYAESCDKMLHSTFLLPSSIVLQLGLQSESSNRRKNSITTTTRF